MLGYSYHQNKGDKLQDGTYLYQNGKFQPVSMADGYWVAERELDRSELVSGMVVGVWTDKKSGKVWLDKTRLVRSLARATQLGTLWNQLAIWDNANKAEVSI